MAAAALDQRLVLGQAATAQTAFLVRSLLVVVVVAEKPIQVVALGVPVAAAVAEVVLVAQRRHLGKAMQAVMVDLTARLLEVVAVAVPVPLVRQELLPVTVAQV